MRAVLPHVVRIFGTLIDFHRDAFDKYVALFASKPEYRVITQFLFEENASQLSKEAGNDKLKLFTALASLDTAEMVCSKSDFESQESSVYNVSALKNPEYYYYNLFGIRVGKLYLLNRLSELTNISAEEKIYINNKILLTFYQTKNDMVPIFSDPALRVPHEIGLK
ncbi:MAG: hypothetical protein JSS96_12175 [Bacteroidetes bacterium]|nr:hypothetical protein [Bacteroidota bacterium]